jgi:protocatechuate 3,4-dioxygenase beta subunit
MGPFYPIELPLDQDNDLVSVRGHSGRPVGELLNVVGQVLDEQGKPYDPNFQGYGRTVTTADGGYRFRTIKPVAYPGRAPHIHFALSSPSFAKFYTQMYLAGAPENETDFLLTRLDRKAQDSLLVSLLKSRDVQKGFAGRFDVVLEKTVLSRGP